MKHKIPLLVALILAAPLDNVQASEGKSSYFISALTGYSTSGISNDQLSYGGSVGTRLSNSVGLGAYFSYSSWTLFQYYPGYAERTGPESLSLYGVEGTYFLDQVLDGLYLGADLGLATFSGVGGSTKVSAGPVLGYEYMLLPQLSVGLKGNVQFQSGYTASNLLAALRIWL